MFANFSYSFTSNAIRSSVNFNDTTGKQTTQSVNVSGNHTLRGYLNYSFKINGPDLHVNVSGNFNQSNNVTIVNDFTNVTRSNNYSGGFGLWKSKEKVYEISLNGNVTYTTSASSDNPAVFTHYFTYVIDPGTDVFLPWHLQIHGDADLNIRPKSAAFPTNNNVFIVNGWIGKKLLKNDQLLLKAAVNDLLDQNTGFNRNVSSSFISQNTVYDDQAVFYVLDRLEFHEGGDTGTELGGISRIDSMIRLVFLWGCLAIVAPSLRAQNNIFLSQGKIEFERRINQFAQREEMREPGDDDSWSDFEKKVMGSKFKTDYFDLLFTRNKTLYKPGRESPDKPSPFFNDPPAHENVIFDDLDRGRMVGQKAIFEQTFLIQDTLRPDQMEDHG